MNPRNAELGTAAAVAQSTLAGLIGTWTDDLESPDLDRLHDALDVLGTLASIGCDDSHPQIAIDCGRRESEAADV